MIFKFFHNPPIKLLITIFGGPYKSALIGPHNILLRRRRNPWATPIHELPQSTSYRNPRAISWIAAHALRLPQWTSRNTRQITLPLEQCGSCIAALANIFHLLDCGSWIAAIYIHELPHSTSLHSHGLGLPQSMSCHNPRAYILMDCGCRSSPGG